MQEDTSPLYYRPYSFSYKHIDKWQEFMSTWKKIPFAQWLNSADEVALIDFWANILQQLTDETEKICVLVPLAVNRAEQKVQGKEEDAKLANGKNENNQTGKEGNGNQLQNLKGGKNEGKTNKKGAYQKKDNVAQVKLDKKVGQVAMRLIDQKFPSLQYAYESLFMGNQKQVLIYRSCVSMNRYLEKYRMPKDFKSKMDDVNKTAEEIYNAKMLNNLALSTFSNITGKKYQQDLDDLREDFSKKLQGFRTYISAIFKDYKENKKAKVFIIQTIRHELYDFFEDLAKQFELYVSNRFDQCNFDEVRDIQIRKQKYEEITEADVKEYQNQQEEKVKYVYVKAPKTPQKPKDIYNIQLMGHNYQNQTWNWRIFLPTCSSYNQFKGIFLRSPEGEGPFEINMQLDEKADYVDVDIFPYHLGKNVIEIYLYNDVGFTKSIEKLIFYNDYAQKGRDPAERSKAVWLLGASQCGVRYDKEGSKLIKLDKKVKSISIYNAAIVCDVGGNAGGWGQMFYTDKYENQDVHTDQQITLHFLNNLRIEEPFLIMQKKYIRKVSCGLGFTLMLTSLGKIWSFGVNKYGQLGQSHLDSHCQQTFPKEISKMAGSGDTSSFITDICATTKGASFAINDSGRLYRWGYNQVSDTMFPVIDRFGTTINYQSKHVLYKNPTPILVAKNIVSEKVKKVEACNEHYFALTGQGQLYGWGLVTWLGCGALKDTKQNNIEDIINPIRIMSGVAQVSTSAGHTIVVTKKGRIMAWGLSSNFSQKITDFIDRPIDITDEYISKDTKQLIQVHAGFNYTLILREDNTIELKGTNTELSIEPKAFQKPIVEVTCSKFEQLFAVMTRE